MSSINPISFIGGQRGEWKVLRAAALCGDPLPFITYLDALPSHSVPATTSAAAWVLRGTNNHTRYSARHEVEAMKAKQEGLGRAEASYAALIPIRKNEAWWAMAQDERRRIFEEESQHIAMSMAYLPAIARRLYHSRDLGEPFDFLTWFEFAPEHEGTFDALLAKLRQSREWQFVEREVDIRLIRHEA